MGTLMASASDFSPLMWSTCSRETSRASKRSARSPAAARRRRVSFLLKPASTSRRVRSVATSVELPLLPLPNTQIRTLNQLSATYRSKQAPGAGFSKALEELYDSLAGVDIEKNAAALFFCPQSVKSTGH